MAIKKTVSKVKSIPTVTVETKKITSEKDACCPMNRCAGHQIVKIGFMVLTVVNTILLISLLAGQDKAEALKVGGSDNYNMLKQIFTTDGYKAQQKQQIEQALQMFSNPEAMQQAEKQAQQQAQPQVQPQVQPQAQPQAQPQGPITQ